MFAFLSGVNADNLELLNLSQSKDCERRICEISECASSFAASFVRLFTDGYSVYEIFEILFSYVDDTQIKMHDFVMPENVGKVASYLSSLTEIDKAVFSSFLLDYVRAECSVSEMDFLPAVSGDETFVYVKNRLADEAYDVFSLDFNDPRVFYSPDFREAVRAVTEEKATYCFLPIQERGAVRLHSISYLLFKNDLKIVDITPVFGVDGNADMKYALCARGFKIPPQSSDDDRYIEIRVDKNGRTELDALLSVARFFGLSVYSIGTDRYDTDDGVAEYYDIVFSQTNSEYSAFLTYLAIFCREDYVCVGIYANIE